jgi:hypothetical protein
LAPKLGFAKAIGSITLAVLANRERRGKIAKKALMTEFRPFSTPGRFWRGNLHSHSNLSDGALDPPRVIEAYQRAGYDFVQLSEHFLARFNWPIADTRRYRTNRFTTLIGAELHAPSTKVGELWHILAAGLPLSFAPAESGETGAAIAKRAIEAGAFVAIAHPAWSQLTFDDGRDIAAHAVEIYNHGCAVENDRGGGWYLLDQLLTSGRRMTAIATDDAHFRNGDFDAFGGWVSVKSTALEPELMVDALKKGHFYSSQGPQIYELSVTRSELSIVCSPVDAITIVGGTSRAISKIGHFITKATFDLSKIDETWRATKCEIWFRIAIIDAAGRRAWTNPIWLDNLQP